MGHKNILVTGGAGFIGSNICLYLKKLYPKARIMALDSLKRRGSELNIKRLSENGIVFLHGDIRCREDLDIKTPIGLIIECSAEPSVLADISSGPEYVINTNLMGMVNCLELARKKASDFIFLSTSRVYPYAGIRALKIKEEKSRFIWNEKSRIAGFSSRGIGEGFSLEGARSLYGATKLSCELLLTEYAANYGIKAVINRMSVVAGAWQFGKTDQGFISLWAMSHLFQKPVSYIGWSGKGKQVRDILHIDDLCRLIAMQADDMGKAGGRVYNVGGGAKNSLSLLELTELCQAVTGNKTRILSQANTRPFDIPVYISDNSRIRADFGWVPLASKEKIIEDICEWASKTSYCPF
ncbi:MAG: NAD-dependent epimerase/dehydratase family protein [Candidatus Omnitrophica bacterium]|nr:NAD-dependent epimerase/dehydratase family protein [Candidatus Omnitrophota bacterium]